MSNALRNSSARSRRAEVRRSDPRCSHRLWAWGLRQQLYDHRTCRVPTQIKLPGPGLSAGISDPRGRDRAQGPHWRREWETPGFDELIGAGAAWKRAAIACPEGPQNSAEPVVRVEPLPSKGRFRVLRRGPSARRLRIRTTCAAYHRPPLGDGTFRALSAAATASAGSSANPSKIGRNRSARSFSADRNL